MSSSPVVEQIRDRIHQLARQISDDYRGRTLYAVGVLEDGFIFMAAWCASSTSQ